MNIIIPLCGIGKRFERAGYDIPKPLIKVFNKEMVCRVIDSLQIAPTDNIFIIYHTSLHEFNFQQIITSRYPFVHLIPVFRRTSGAADTVLEGIRYILANKLSTLQKSLIVDCDTLYHINIKDKLMNMDTNAIIYFEDNGLEERYSYDTIVNDIVTDIVEKRRISNYANTGAYFFNNMHELQQACEHVIQRNITSNGEHYTSCVIKYMISQGHVFRGVKIEKYQYASLGTPDELQEYLDRHLSFLFDLDGTIVKTDAIYYKVWSDILQKFNITLTEAIFNQHIQGNNDECAMNCLSIDKCSYSISAISQLKDELFIQYIDEIVVIDGIHAFMRSIKEHGYSVCIVSNSNRTTCECVLKHIGLYSYIDNIIIGSECSRPKPYPDPYQSAINHLGTTNNKCIIFEDSNPGIISARNVHPKMLIGIDNGTNSKILDELQIETRLTTYNNFSLHTICNPSIDIIAAIRDMVSRSLSKKYDIMSIGIDETKLKGGYISDVVHVDIQLKDGNTLDCILKYENDYTSSLTKMAYRLGLFEREYYFYESISDYICVNVPKYIGTIKDGNYVSKGILLENLKQDGFHLNLNLNKESVDVSLKVIEQCARFHAQFWDKNLMQSFKGLKSHNDSMFRPAWGNFVREKWPIFLEKWRHIMNPVQLMKLEQMVQAFDDTQERLSHGCLTLCHGDVKSANIFYKKINNTDYIPYFIDWQYVACGKGVQDIVFFMIESFTIDSIKSYSSLFKLYYYAKLKEYGITNYSIHDYENDFKDAIAYFPLFVAMWFGTTPNDELIDISFPFMFIQKLLYVIEYIS